MRLEFVKKTYSHNPWRLVDSETGREVSQWTAYPAAGKTRFPPIRQPLGGRTRRDIERQALDLLAQLSKESEDLAYRLALVANFPDHPGGHEADDSAAAAAPKDWRAGWIAAVQAIYQRVIERPREHQAPAPE